MKNCRCLSMLIHIDLIRVDTVQENNIHTEEAN